MKGVRGAVFEKLCEPLQIKGMKLKNRVLMAAVATKLGNEFGLVTERNIEFYRERARGDVALIVIENTCVDWPVGKAGVAPLRLDHDRYIMGMNLIAEAVQPYGTRLATQLQHTGAQTNLLNTDGEQPVAPSAIPLYGVTPRVLTGEEILALEDRFAAAAGRTKSAGFDCVEIHGAHGYIFTQFLSPLLNTRTDEYGGSLDGRMRFALEVVRKVRQKVGPDFPIMFRYSADEHVKGGLPLEEAKEFARRLVEAGVDIISVSAGLVLSRYWIFPPMGLPRGCNIGLAREIKSVSRVPVAVVGRITEPSLAERILQEGCADLIALGRPLLADPHWVLKAREGRPEDIRPCIACNNGCIGRTHHHWRIGCDVNPAAGDELNYRVVPAAKPKKVFVAGAGPAGLEAAVTAARRGHKVTFFEAGAGLGGKLLVAGIPSFKAEIRSLLQYLVREVQRAGVEVRLGQPLDVDTVRRLAPDAVIVATGATAATLEPVAGGPAVVTAEEAWLRPESVAGRIVIVGGGDIGCETALYLADTGRKDITIVEAEPDILRDCETSNRMWLKERLQESGVKVLAQTPVRRVGRGGAMAGDTGKERVIEADTVVVALGAHPNDALAQGLKGLVPTLFVVGDASAPRRIWHAIHEGSFAGRAV
jgi:2,4-dienoyl-CoA reductase-like NADH-dependent reductase (Old Yellow Enzyme family)/thioredoxin reductase